MLTADLLRVTRRKGVITPQLLDVENDEAQSRAEVLCELFQSHVDQPKGELDAQVDAAIGHGTDFLVWRGLAKLLYDRSTFDTVAVANPVDIRRAVWERAAAHGVFDAESRGAVLQEVATDLGAEPHEIEDGLYADLEARQRLTKHESMEPMALLHRYNLALAQAVLYRATSLTITLRSPRPNKLRYLLQVLKFHRLMFRCRRDGKDWELHIDGPASLFSKSRKYGLQMAIFLPAVVLAKSWSLVAEIDEGDGKTFQLELDESSGLVSHYRARGQWVAEEEKWFEKRFEDLGSDWTLERSGSVLDLPGGETLVTDYRLTDPDGREVFVEIVGFWRRAYLERRIEWLDSLQEPVVLVVAERLKTDRAKLESSAPQVVFFKGVILADKVLEAAQAALDG